MTTTTGKKVGCDGKFVYPSEKEADLASKRLRKLLGKPHHAYKCVWGYHWHLTTRPKKRMKAIQRYVEGLVPKNIKHHNELMEILAHLRGRSNP